MDSYNYTNVTTSDEQRELKLFYVICEVLVAIFAVIGNAMVIIVFRKERRLRRRTNYYIISLAAADFLVGLLGIPFAIMASVGLPKNLYACLFTVSLLVVLCTISIFCLVAVSVDRYWAILYPMGYSRNVRTKTALVIISVCWVAGSMIGFLPLMGWSKGELDHGSCFFLGVMDYNYLVFLYFGTIITPALLLAAFYAHIYRVVLKQLRNIVTMNPENGTSTSGRTTGGTMLRMLGAQQKREVKATQNLSIIVLFFMICWIPLYTINCVLAFCENCDINLMFVDFCIILSHLNSACNPILYAYHLKDFRAALKNFLFSIFRPQHSIPSNLHCRPSLASNAGLNNNSNYYRSVRESRSALPLSSHNKLYLESKFCQNRKQMSRSMTLPAPPKIAAIVPRSVALAAATAGTGDNNREIWRISEVPSISDEHYKEFEASIVHRSVSPYQRTPSECSGNFNTAFIDGSGYDDGSDDVFLDDLYPIANIKYDDSDFDNLSDTMSRVSELAVIPVIKKNITNCLSSSSPQLSRNVFLVETELGKDNCPNVVRSSSVADKEARHGKRGLKFSLSGDFINSPTKSMKLSPFKAMGEFLLNSSKHSRTSSFSENSVSPKSAKEKSNGMIYKFDNHSFGN